MPQENEHIVIVGGGMAGAYAARTLREEGFSGALTMVCGESHPPYERPPLSKAVLSGVADPKTVEIFPPDELGRLNIDLRLGVFAESVDLAKRQVRLRDGGILTYTSLVLTTGGHARSLAIPGGTDVGVRVLRTLADAQALRERLLQGGRLLVIGGGWIGLEVAATASLLGNDVTVVEAASRLCSRAAPPAVGDYLLALHRRRGIDVRLETTVARLEKVSNNSARAHLSDGSTLDIAAVLAGIGLVPETTLAAAAGLDVEDGILTDDQGRTSDPVVFAAGDCARWTDPASGHRLRSETWASARQQGVAVGRAILGLPPSGAEVPWFWSDQFDVNIQILGAPTEWGAPVVRGDQAADAFTALFHDGASLAACVAVNTPRDIAVARRLIAQDIPVDRATLADESVPLKSLLKRG